MASCSTSCNTWLSTCWIGLDKRRSMTTGLLRPRPSPVHRPLRPPRQRSRRVRRQPHHRRRHRVAGCDGRESPFVRGRSFRGWGPPPRSAHGPERLHGTRSRDAGEIIGHTSMEGLNRGHAPSSTDGGTCVSCRSASGHGGPRGVSYVVNQDMSSPGRPPPCVIFAAARRDIPGRTRRS